MPIGTTIGRISEKRRFYIGFAVLIISDPVKTPLSLSPFAQLMAFSPVQQQMVSGCFPD
jgi:hypothetical protein